MTAPTDFRALCAELAKKLDEKEVFLCRIEGDDYCEHPLVARARAALEAVPASTASASDKALEVFSDYFRRNYPGPDTIIHKPDWHAPRLFRAAADAIARYSTPAPVPVAERLPEARDCCPHPRRNAGEWCWGLERARTSYGLRAVWRFMSREAIQDEAESWAPWWALPLPGTGEHWAPPLPEVQP